MVTNKDIIDTATGFIGKLKYVFGGNNIAGGSGDCSDFTEYVFKVHGFNIGYDTASQYMNTTHVPENFVEGGDLVFFKNTYDSGKIDGVSHVGIMVNGEQFIHLSSKGCYVDYVHSDYWKEHFLDFRRVTGLSFESIDAIFDVTNDSVVNVTLVDDTESNKEKIRNVARIVSIVGLLIVCVVFSVSIFKDEIIKGVINKYGG